MSKRRIRLIGLKNCDSCRKARRWFDASGHDYSFEEIRDPNVLDDVLARLASHDDWERFVNRRSTTWRKLSAQERDMSDRRAALELLAAHPTLVKRPVVIVGSDIMAGFDKAAMSARLR